MSLMETLVAEPPPLRVDANGVIRVGGTRVTLDVLVHAYERGETPEEIALNFDALSLADVYGAIRYYLRHRDEVASYLKDREQKSDELRSMKTALLPSRDLKNRIMARQNNLHDPSTG